MRVVAGIARGRRIVAPEGVGTRPTGDRVREAVFNALGSLGAVDGAAVLDLFAGSGALGIEALSRGASTATFVDSDGRALAAVRANLAGTGLAADAEVVHADAVGYLDRAAQRRWDLALLDPPYEFDGWEALLERLDADVVVCESDRAIDLGVRFELVREKRYGSTVVLIARAEQESAD